MGMINCHISNQHINVYIDEVLPRSGRVSLKETDKSGEWFQKTCRKIYVKKSVFENVLGYNQYTWSVPLHAWFSRNFRAVFFRNILEQLFQLFRQTNFCMFCSVSFPFLRRCLPFLASLFKVYSTLYRQTNNPGH